MAAKLIRPIPKGPNESWQHADLYRRVCSALSALPFHFEAETFIEGISAVDIFTLNSALGATIEEQLVGSLNQMRSIWDTDGRYADYGFVRQPQTFPDVLLKRTGDDNRKSIMGIELKGWYLLSKEGEPSFRYQVTPAACSEQDLLAVVPWVLKNVISGSPRVLSPYIVPARFAAEMRNFHWSTKKSSGDVRIASPKNVAPYPNKTEQILDIPNSDRGGNFGRYARSGAMDDYLDKAKRELICGIAAEHWLHFFKIFAEQQDEKKAREQIEKLRAKTLQGADGGHIDKDAIGRILAEIENLLD